jgi:hypothetical protein
VIIRGVETMGASSIRAGQAYVEIATKQGSFDKGMAQVQAAMARLKGVATTMGTGIAKGYASAQGALSGFSKAALSVPAAVGGAMAVGGLTALVKGYADAGSAVDDMAQRTGMSAEAVSSLGYAAKLSGTDVGTLEKGVRKMQSGIADAMAGVPGAVDKFAALGLSVSDLAKMSPDEQFIAIADKLSMIQDPALKSAAAMEYFGKAGADLVPMLSEGGKGIRKLQGDAARLGQTMSAKDAAAAAKLGDVFDRLFGVIGGLNNRIGSALAPLLTSVGEKIVDIATNVSTWVSENQELIVTIAKWTVAGAGLLAGLFALGGAAAVASMAMGGVAAIAGTIATGLALVTGVITAMLSPIGLVVAGITGASAAFLHFSGTGGALATYLGNKFTELRAIVLPVFGAIKTALLSGQWQAAGKVAMTGLQLTFRVATRDIYAGWLTISTKILDTWTWLSAEVSIGAIGMVANVVNTISGIPTQLAKGFATAVTWLQGAFDETVNFIAKKLLYLYSLLDRSVDYENSAMQLDRDAAKRAAERQKSLDTANQTRDNDLQRGNAGRLAIADQAQQGIRNQAQATMDDRKDRNGQALGAFDQRIQELKDSLKPQIEEINKGGSPLGFLSFLGPLGAAVGAVVEQAAGLAQGQLGKEIPTRAQVKAVTATQTGGTFSGFGAGILGGTTSALDRMADQTKTTNELLVKIEQNTKDQKDPKYGP